MSVLLDHDGNPWKREKPIDDFAYPLCTDVNAYEKLSKIGQGTFGEVFKARHRAQGSLVALKRILMTNDQEGFPITSLREIRMLQQLQHANIVNLREICRSKLQGGSSAIYLVFDFCDHDLAGLLANTQVKFSLEDVKSVMQQLLNGLFFLLTKRIIHRDVKAANILLTKQGILKLADFGLARSYLVPKNGKPNRFTNRVVTLWYRSPELLLGDRNYGHGVDLWGAGCIMAEMWTRTPIFPGTTEQQQISLISQLCGSVNTKVWPGVQTLELFGKLELPRGCPRRVIEKLRGLMRDPFACDLVDKLLTLDPLRRIDADEALDHDFFWKDPMPSDLGNMLKNHGGDMFEYLAPSRRPDANRQVKKAYEKNVNGRDLKSISLERSLEINFL